MVYDFLNWILIGVYNTTVWFVGACCFGAYWTAPLRVVIAVSRSLRLILYKISLPYIHIRATGKVNQGAIFISIIFCSVLCKVRIFFSLCTEYTRGINKSFNRKWYFRQSNCCSKLSKELGKGGGICIALSIQSDLYNKIQMFNSSFGGYFKHLKYFITFITGCFRGLLSRESV